MNKTITLEFPEKKQEALSHFLKKKEQDSGFITSQLTKFMDLWALKIRPLEKTHHTPLIVHIQPQKHLVTTLSGLFMKPMDCRP